MAIAPIQGALRRSVRPPCSLPLRRTRSFSHDAHSRRPSSTSRSASGPASSAATRSGACALALLLLSLRRPASRTLTPPLRSTGTSTTCAMVRCSLALFMSVRSPSAPQLTRSAPPSSPPPLLRHVLPLEQSASATSGTLSSARRRRERARKRGPGCGSSWCSRARGEERARAVQCELGFCAFAPSESLLCERERERSGRRGRAGAMKRDTAREAALEPVQDQIAEREGEGRSGALEPALENSSHRDHRTRSSPSRRDVARSGGTR